MNLPEIESVANDLIKQHLSGNWPLIWVKEKKILGRCVYGTKEIQLSKYWCLVLSEFEILDTIKHEIAHAQCAELGQFDNHGRYWKAACNRIGARPIPCYNGVIKPPVRYKANCECGAEYKTGNLNDRIIWCNFCKLKLDYKDQYARISSGIK